MEGDNDLSLCEIDPGERARVQNIVDEAKQPDYWFAASKDGSRESHYRGAHFLYDPISNFNNLVVHSQATYPYSSRSCAGVHRDGAIDIGLFGQIRFLGQPGTHQQRH